MDTVQLVIIAQTASSQDALEPDMGDAMGAAISPDAASAQHAPS